MSLLGNIWVKLGLKSDDFNRGLDNAEKKTSKFGDVMKGIAGKVLTVAAAFKVLAGTFKTLAAFEASASRLASVLGKTKEGISGLTQSAIDLGRKTQYTASEVVGLQTELAKLGFTEPQIKSMQESVLKFAAAVGTDLPSAAARAGATMRGFGLTAEETSDMLNVMAISTSKSALSFSYLDSTLGKLVPVTKAYGFDIRDTITLLGTMANAGIDASSAGTALRRMFVELSNASSKLNRAIGKQPKTMAELIDALDTLNKKNLSVAESSDLVGKFAAPAFAALVSGAQDCRALYGELENTNGALDDMYRTMTDNVTGAVKELQSAWEGFILNLQSSNGVIARMIRGLTKLVNLANSSFFTETRVGENKAYYDLMWNGKGGFDDNSYAAVQMRFAKERERLQKSLGWAVEGSSTWKDIQEQIEGLNRSESDWFQSLIDQGNEAGGAIAGIGAAAEDAGSGLDALLKGIGKGNAKDKLKEEAREYAEEAKAIAEADAEVAEQGRKWLEQYQELNPAIHDGTRELKGLAEEVAFLVEKEQEGEIGTGKFKDRLDELRAGFFDLTDAEAEALTGLADEMVTADVDSAIDQWLDDLEKQKERAEDISQDFADALRSGIIAGLDEVAEAIGTGDWDTTSLVKALITPLADMAISAGTVILSTGEAVEALKKALESLNGYAAIVAGAALIGVGVAAKALLANISKSAGSGTAAQPSYSYTGGYGINPQGTNMGQMEITGTVTVKGQDLQIALDNYNRNRGR